MKPAVKYAAVGVLYATEAEGIWEHEMYRKLQGLYSRADLQSLREDLISMNTVGWLRITEERDHRGQLLRRYALTDSIRPFVRFQLRLNEVLAFLSETDPQAATSPAAAPAERRQP